MVLGIGTDLMRIDRLHPPYLREGDPFLAATFTAAEIKAAAGQTDPYRFFAMRFCGKEAVFKALGLGPEHVRLSEIEILNDENGAPTVALFGSLKARAEARGVERVLLSLTSDGGLAQAAAISLGACGQTAGAEARP
ncbi:MAG: holo-ACP synthase [Clostridia bacterium]|nr:holo-ACP synthase [Clostridia bacterium]